MLNNDVFELLRDTLPCSPWLCLFQCICAMEPDPDTDLTTDEYRVEQLDTFADIVHQMSPGQMMILIRDVCQSCETPITPPSDNTNPDGGTGPDAGGGGQPAETPSDCFQKLKDATCSPTGRATIQTAITIAAAAGTALGADLDVQSMLSLLQTINEFCDHPDSSQFATTMSKLCPLWSKAAPVLSTVASMGQMALGLALPAQSIFYGAIGQALDACCKVSLSGGGQTVNALARGSQLVSAVKATKNRAQSVPRYATNTTLVAHAQPVPRIISPLRRLVRVG